MDWRRWLTELGLSLPRTPDIDSLVVTVAAIVGAYWLGWMLAARAGPRMTATIGRWTGRPDGAAVRLACALIRNGVPALLLLIVQRSVPLGVIAQVLLAAALGLAVAMLAYRVTRAAGVGGLTAAVLGMFALVATAAGALGGLEPLVDALGDIGFDVGKRRFSLLATINFVVVAAILFGVAQLANRVLAHSIGRLGGLDISQRVLAQKLAGIAVIVVGVLVGIDLLGIDLTALAVFSGALGLAVGFGLQKTLGNLIAGLILLMDRSVKPGDVIVVGDSFGAVSRIGVRAVSVITRDGKEHLIPNELLMTERVENWSYSSRDVRMHIAVTVAFGSDQLLAQRLMMEATIAAKRVLADPEPTVWMMEFGENGVKYDILAWISDPEAGVGNVRSDILNRLWALFAAHGVEIPYPQRDIRIRGVMPVDGDGLASPPESH